MNHASNPAAPRVAGTYRPKGSLSHVAASEGYTYVVENDTRLRVLQIANPAKPRAVGSSDLPDDAQGLAVAGNFAYVTTSESLRVLDVSDAVSPQEVGACGGLELAGRVTVAGKYAYVAADFNGMRIIDVANPAPGGEAGRASAIAAG